MRVWAKNWTALLMATVAGVIAAQGFAARAQTPGLGPSIAPPSAPAEIRLRPDQVQTLRTAITAATTHGLDPRIGDLSRIDPLLRSSDPSVRREAEARLVEATIVYAKAVRTGQLASGDFRSNWAIRPAAFDARAGFREALTADQLGAWLATLPPPYQGYRDLLPVLARYRAIAAAGGWGRIDARTALKAGAEDDRVLLLRARLAAEGEAFGATPAQRLYDPSVAAAVSRFQRAHGIEATGIADKVTLTTLNVPVEVRLEAIEASLERWRWLPRALPLTRVQVNVAAAVLEAVQGGQTALVMRTVVGRRGDPTPMLADEIEAVVFNPPWNVPASIANNEILPKARRDPGYLAREGFIFIQDGNNRRLQQRPGPKAALGRYKFDLPNRFNVYLHDTPSKAAFASDRRNLSHGCVRVERPRELALWLLREQPGWGADTVDRTVAAGATVSTRLKTHVPVFLMYWTAFVAPGGGVNFREDVYGWDKQLLARIDD